MTMAEATTATVWERLAAAAEDLKAWPTGDRLANLCAVLEDVPQVEGTDQVRRVREAVKVARVRLKDLDIWTDSTSPEHLVPVLSPTIRGDYRKVDPAVKAYMRRLEGLKHSLVVYAPFVGRSVLEEAEAALKALRSAVSDYHFAARGNHSWANDRAYSVLSARTELEAIMRTVICEAPYTRAVGILRDYSA